ncbi:MAG: major facilitator superfamily 1 [Alphaproteobacteria bacterium]|nr:major facilitator superfamily 1 [Alphaproteobacteria bacterium]MDB5741457.1 major facilitator superfamily 1 [Alphaproteobacteria bacterium]
MTQGAEAGGARTKLGASIWIGVWLLALGCVIAYVDRVNLSFAVIDKDFKHFFQISNTERGLVNSAFFWSYAALQIPAGWVVDRYGAKYPLAICFAVWSALTAFTAFTTGFETLFAVRLLLGAGEALMHPASMRWIRYHIGEKRRGIAIGIYMSGSKFGPALGATLSALLIQSYGWRAMFLILGVAGMVWLLPWLFLARNDGGTVAPVAGTSSAPDAPMRSLLASPILLGVIIGTFSYMYFVYFCMTWMPAYLQEARGLSLSASGFYTTFSFAGMAVMSIVGGLAADWIIGRGHDAIFVRKAFTIAGFLLASTEVFSPLLQSLNLALIVSIFSLSGLGLATANYWALTQTLIPGNKTGRIVGIQNCAASVAGILAPIITGWLVQRTGGYAAAMEMVLFFLACGVLSYAFLVRAPSRA